jgi:hypothetical protein
VLQIEEVPQVFGHRSPISAEVWALNVAHGRETLLPLRVFLIVDREEHDRHGSALTQGSESYVRHLLNDIINLSPDDGPDPRCRGVKWYLHPDLTNIKAMSLKRAAAVEGNGPIVGEADECISKDSWEPRAVLSHGTKTPVLAEGAVGVVIHVHL